MWASQSHEAQTRAHAPRETRNETRAAVREGRPPGTAPRGRAQRPVSRTQNMNISIRAPAPAPLPPCLYPGMWEMGYRCAPTCPCSPPRPLSPAGHLMTMTMHDLEGERAWPPGGAGGGARRAGGGLAGGWGKGVGAGARGWGGAMACAGRSPRARPRPGAPRIGARVFRLGAKV